MMIEQRPINPDGTPGLWDTEEPGYVPRARQWLVAAMTEEVDVVVRNHPVLAAGEDWSGYPPTLLLTWAEWVSDHATVYGMTLSGRPVTDDTADRAAWRKVRRFVNGTDPYDEATVRAVVGALRRIIKGVVAELEE